VKIDHLVADIHGDCARRFAYLQAKSAIERQHRFGVLHRECNMIEPADAPGLLRQGGGAAGCCGRGDDRFDKGTT
jgi:hypothetical protein